MTVAKVKVKMGDVLEMFVEGMDMNCPLCGKLVKSGEKTHYCETPRPKAKGQRLKAGSK